MYRATYETTRRGRVFAGRERRELPDHPGLAIRADAWYLHDLTSRFPAKHSDTHSSEELLTLGYNAGPATMTAFAHGITPGRQSSPTWTGCAETGPM